MNRRNGIIPDDIFQSITKLRENNELEDFKVRVEGEIYSCKSAILALCSEFFNLLLRSNMKEKHEMEVELKDISSSIFQDILNSLYTGCELLTKENVLEVWSAVHLLQIQFLIEHCENFVMADLSLDNVGIYQEQADYLQSVRVHEPIMNILCKHFETFRKTEAFLQMNFQDLREIIKSDRLKISCEDVVLYSIFDWATYGKFSLTSHDESKDTQKSADGKDSSDLTNATHVFGGNNDLSNLINATQVNDDIKHSPDLPSATKVSANINVWPDLTNGTQVSADTDDSPDLTNAKKVKADIGVLPDLTKATQICADLTNTTHVCADIINPSESTNAKQVCGNNNDPSDLTNATQVCGNNNDSSELSSAAQACANDNGLHDRYNAKQVCANSNDLPNSYNASHISDNIIGTSDLTNATQVCAGGINYSSDSYNPAHISDNVNDSRELCLEVQRQNCLNSTNGIDSSYKIETLDTEANKFESNERQKMIEPLIKTSRYSLASEFGLNFLLENKISQNNPNIKDIFSEAMSFKSSRYWHGYYPSSAIHRDCSRVRHAGIYSSDKYVDAIGLKKFERFLIGRFHFKSESLPFYDLTSCNLVVYNGELYACITNNRYAYRFSRVPVIKRKSSAWEFVVDFNKRASDQFVVNDKYLYSISRKRIDRFNPNSEPIKVERFDFYNEYYNLIHAFSFYKDIILFTSIYNAEIEGVTRVYSWNTETKKDTRIAHLNFSCSSMASFCNGKTTYILESSGKLLKFEQTEGLFKFTFLQKLWTGVKDIKGVVLFNDTLLIASESSEMENLTVQFEGVFSSIKFLKVPNITSNFLHYVQ